MFVKKCVLKKNLKLVPNYFTFTPINNFWTTYCNCIYDKNGLAGSCFTHGAPNCAFAFPAGTGVHGSGAVATAAPANNPLFVLNGCCADANGAAAVVGKPANANGVGVYVAADGTNCVDDGTNGGVCFISLMVGFGIRSNGSGCWSEKGFAARGGGVGLSEKL